MIRTLLSATLSILVVSSVGCAGLDARIVENGEDTHGFRYYMPHPYILISQESAKPGDSILFEKIVQQVDTAAAPSLVDVSLRQASDVVGHAVQLTVSPPSALESIVDKNKMALQKAGSVYLWTPASQDEHIFLVLKDPKLIAGGEKRSFKVTAEGRTEAALKGTLDISAGPLDKDKIQVEAAANEPPKSAKKTLSVVYLPGFEKEIAVEPTEGLGTAKYSLSFKDGWMLSSVNGEVDSKVPETITATAGLVESIGSALPGILTILSGAGVPLPADKQPKELAPGLYYMKFGPTGIFEGLIPVGQI